MISRALLNAPFFIPKDADLLRNRKVNTKKRQNRHLPELAFLILGTYFTAPLKFHFWLAHYGGNTVENFTSMCYNSSDRMKYKYIFYTTVWGV